MGRKTNNPNMFNGYCAIGGYLIHSYLYYEHGRPVISDAEYDKLCKHILKHYDEIEHPHKKYCRKEDLVCGTGYSIKWELMPQRIILAAHYLYKKEMKSELAYVVSGRNMIAVYKERYGAKTPRNRKRKSNKKTLPEGKSSRRHSTPQFKGFNL